MARPGHLTQRGAEQRLHSAPMPIAFHLAPVGYRQRVEAAPSYWPVLPPPPVQHVQSVKFVLRIAGAPEVPLHALEDWVRTATPLGRDEGGVDLLGNLNLRYRDVHGMEEHIQTADRSIFDDLRIVVHVPAELNPALTELCCSQRVEIPAMQLASSGRLPRDIIPLDVLPQNAVRATRNAGAVVSEPVGVPAPLAPGVPRASPPRLTLPMPKWTPEAASQVQEEWNRHKTWQAGLGLDYDGLTSRRLLLAAAQAQVSTPQPVVVPEVSHKPPPSKPATCSASLCLALLSFAALAAVGYNATTRWYSAQPNGIALAPMAPPAMPLRLQSAPSAAPPPLPLPSLSSAQSILPSSSTALSSPEMPLPAASPLPITGGGVELEMPENEALSTGRRRE